MKAQQKILKKYPMAKLYTATNGYFIGYETEDGNLVNILSDLLLPNQSTKEQAWESALLSVKTSQNFNRTHLLRVDMYSELDKQDRIEKRKNKGKISKEKSNREYIYF